MAVYPVVRLLPCGLQGFVATTCGGCVCSWGSGDAEAEGVSPSKASRVDMPATDLTRQLPPLVGALNNLASPFPANPLEAPLGLPELGNQEQDTHTHTPSFDRRHKYEAQWIRISLMVPLTHATKTVTMYKMRS